MNLRKQVLNFVREIKGKNCSHTNKNFKKNKISHKAKQKEKQESQRNTANETNNVDEK